jgi:hypothetical protein
MHTHQSRPKSSASAPLQQKTEASNDRSSAAGMMNLQGTIGNRGVQRMIQAKMTVGPVGDPYEQEADQVASEVVQQLQMKPTLETIQRMELPEEEELQMKPTLETIQRMELPEEEELQMKPAVEAIQRMELPEEEELQMKPAEGGFDVSASVEQRIQAKNGSGSKMDEQTRSGMEEAFGADFGGVSIHHDAEAGGISDSIGAQAFTQGQDVFFANGKYDPGSKGGQELLAHELTHVVQQTGGQVE